MNLGNPVEEFAGLRVHDYNPAEGLSHGVECAYRIAPLFDASDAEDYVVQTFDGERLEMKERMRFQWFVDSGSFSRQRSEEESENDINERFGKKSEEVAGADLKRAKEAISKNLPKAFMIGVVIAIGLVLLLSSWVWPNPSETSTVTRFGVVVREEPSGFHFKLPYPFEDGETVLYIDEP